MNERAIFDAALDIADRADRAAYLDHACAGDADLRRNVEGLIDAQSRLGDFLASPPLGVGPRVRPAVCEGTGDRVGPYKLVEQIGEGGMGLVFLAEQQRPVRRRVALKVLKAGMDTAQVVARFEAERQALALMDHPHIARVFDAGATASGRPYFAMELVRGLPVTDYCDQARLGVRDRLILFAAVCRAVQHAHQRGVIHRDLKPSNVLVTVVDGAAVPKVIDFGVAKATGERLTERTLATGFHQLIGTPLYMSPEQAELSGVDVDTRADVYALGVLLYELLTGGTPFDAAALRAAGFDGMRRMIREEDPPSPSRRLATLGAAASSTVSERRGVDARRYAGLLRGDLDWVVMKALEKDRNRRYESASALAADVERYLAGEAVEARPPSAAYRLRKFAGRHKAALSATGVVAAALVAATTVSVWQAVKAREAEKRASNEAAVARAVNNFLQADLLGQADAAATPGQEFGDDGYLTVREALDRAAARIGERFQDQPLVEAAIRTAIGNSYCNLNEHRSAVPHLERAVALRRSHLGSGHRDTFASMGCLAVAYTWVGRHSDAIALRQQFVTSTTARLGPDNPETLAGVGLLAGAYLDAGEWDTSVPLLEQLLEKRRAICGPTHPATLDTLFTLARNYRDVGRLAESIDLHKKALDNFQSTLGPEHGTTIGCKMALARVCQRAGKLDQSDRLLRETLNQMRQRADSLVQRIRTANTCGWLARNLVLQQQFAAAEPLAREAVAAWEKHQPDASGHYHWLSVLGTALLGQEKFAEAEPCLLRGYQGLKEREAILLADRRREVAEAGEWVVRYYEATRQPEKARAWRKKLVPKP